jgi:hypothetical protein
MAGRDRSDDVVEHKGPTMFAWIGVMRALKASVRSGSQKTPLEQAEIEEGRMS